MALKLLIVTASMSEAGILKSFPVSAGRYKLGRCEIDLLVTGVGGISTSWAMKKWLDSNPVPDLAVNAGIAGSYNDEFEKGQVVVPVTDCFADMGIEDGHNYLTLSEAGLTAPDKFPFTNGLIKSENEYVNLALTIMQKAKAITVNTSSGSESGIERLKKKFNPDIETMEGATFFYICAMEKIPFLALRSISNRVEPRNRSLWDIPLALKNLEEKLKELILMF
jgi:futalosine hydrolase